MAYCANRGLHIAFAAFLIHCASCGLISQSEPMAKLEQGTLTAPGSPPFHLEASIQDDEGSKIVIDWLDAKHWRREIKTSEFRQTFVQNGERIFEQDSDQYFPLDLRTLVTAMVDPGPILAQLRPGDRVQTKANGLSTESGLLCFEPGGRMCLRMAFGLTESIEPPGHQVQFTDYEKFQGKRIARKLMYTVSAGDYTKLEVTGLKELKHPAKSLFKTQVANPTSTPLQVVDLTEQELSDLESTAPEIIWPQVLDGAQTGSISFYFSIDPTGKVREVHPLSISSERSNDTAIRQLMRWKFRPAVKNGIPVQVEGSLTFQFDTRAFGPKDVLSDAGARKLVTNMVEPVIAPGRYPAGTVFSMWVAVDSDGIVIEKIIKDGPSELFGPCDAAIKQWHFQPILENGQPRPYRALIEFPIH